VQTRVLHMSGAAHRKNPRFDVEHPVRVKRGDEEVDAIMNDLSLGGARLVVALDPPPTIGDELGLRFSIPTLDGALDVRAQVRWRSDSEGVSLGVQFLTGFRAKQTWALGRYLDSLSDKAGG
jgi:hypothetical protein